MHIAINFDQLINSYLVPFGLKLCIAIAIWIAGSAGIYIVAKTVRRLLQLRHLDPTLVNYSITVLNVASRVLLVMIILEVCGLPTTSFAAMLGAVGVAIGIAWSGLLSNFAAGIFLIVLRPFKISDYITAAGQTGTVVEIGLFTTTIATDNNLNVVIGNNKLFSDIITNYTANPTRRVDLKCQLAYGIDPDDAIARLTERIKRIPNVLEHQSISVTVAEVNAAGVLLAVRLYSPIANFGQVYNDTNLAIAEVCAAAGWPAPGQPALAAS